MAADKIAFLGAGKVGCFVGGCWQAAGLPVTFIGRPKLAREIAKHGLNLSDNSGWHVHLDEVDYRTDPSALTDAAIIAVTVRSGSTVEAAREIARQGRRGALVISFQNGVSNVDVLKRELGSRFEVLRGMVYYNIADLGQGHFHRGVTGDVRTEDRPETRRLADRIGGGPAELKLSERMLEVSWGKLLNNLNNAVNSLSGRTLLEELRERDYRRVLAASQREGLTLLKRAGIRPDKVGPVSPQLLPIATDVPDWLYKIVIRKWKLDARNRSSMADHLAAGQKTEVDHINGELVALAERLGTDAPVNRKIVQLIRAAEAGAKPWDPAALRREVLGR